MNMEQAAATVIRRINALEEYKDRDRVAYFQMDFHLKAQYLCRDREAILRYLANQRDDGEVRRI